MELISLVVRLTTRIFGFAAIFAILGGAWYLFQPAPPQAFAALFSLAILVSWKTYDKVIGDFCNDAAVLIRLVSIKGVSLITVFDSLFDKVQEVLYPKPMAQFMPEVVTWEDVEASRRVRRTLRNGRLTVLLGQYDGAPQLVDLADDIGKMYISAPDRTGKTSLIKEMLGSILLGHPLAKNEINFVFVDITRDLAMFRPLGRYTHDMSEAHRILVELGEEAERRNLAREKHNHADWWHEIPAPHRPRLTLLIIDEAIQVLQRGGPPVKKAWENLIDIGWKNGLIMVTTSLYTRGDLIPTEFTALMRGKVIGYMGTRQGLINVIEIDFYEKHKELLEGFVNQKYHFALCIRGGLNGRKDAKPILFRTIFVPKERLLQLVQDAVIDPNDAREIVLAVWWNSKGVDNSERIAQLARQFVETHDTTIKAETIHKKFVLDTLGLARMANIATQSGPNEKYTPCDDISSYGALVEKWDAAVLGGLLEKRVVANGANNGH